MRQAADGAGLAPETAAMIEENLAMATITVTEKELMSQERAEGDQLLNERDNQLIALRRDLQQKTRDVDFLTQKMGQLTSGAQIMQLRLSEASAEVEGLRQSKDEAESRLQAITEGAMQHQAVLVDLQNKLDTAELRSRQLENKLLLREAGQPIEYSLVSPFLIFDTCTPGLPVHGMSLAPAPVERPSPPPAPSPVPPTSPREKQVVGEKVRVRFSAPKVVSPVQNKRSPTRGSTAQTPLRPILPLQPPDQVDLVVARPAEGAETTYESARTSGTGGSPSYYDENRVRSTMLLPKTMGRLQKQILRLENALELKNHELIALRDNFMKMKTNAASTVVRADRTDRELRKATGRATSLDDKLQTAYGMIERRDAEITELRQLLRDIQQSAQPVLVQEMLQHISEDRANRTAMRQLRAQLIMNETLKSYSISQHLTRMMEHQMRTVRRWEDRRNEIQYEQRTRLRSVLEGMQLLYTPLVGGTSSGVRPNTPGRTVRHLGPMTVTNLIPPAGELRRPGFRSPLQPIPTDRAADVALVNAAAGFQDIEPVLAKGVVAEPIVTNFSSTV
jgi:hypothetical protein